MTTYGRGNVYPADVATVILKKNFCIWDDFFQRRLASRIMGLSASNIKVSVDYLETLFC